MRYRPRARPGRLLAVTDSPVPDLGDADAALLSQAITQAANLAGLGVLITRSNAAQTGLELMYWNASVERMTGRSRREIVERGGLFPFVPPEQRSLISGLHGARVRGEQLPSRFAGALTHVSGRRVPLDVTLVPITIAGQALNVSFLVDLTQREAAEAALQSSQKLFKQVVTSAPDAIYILHWPRVLFANPAGARLLDFDTPEQAVGLNLLERFTPDATAPAESPAGSARASEPQRYRGKNPNGREFAVEVSSLPIQFDGEPALLFFARDVTDRDAMLNLLLEVHKQSAVSVLAAGVAHEINNPLAYVLLNLEFLARELLELGGGDPERIDAMRQRLADTRQGAERVKTIVRDLQALTCKDEDIRGPVDLDQVITDALHMAKHQLRQLGRVSTDFRSVPCVLGNSTRLEQLFFNLIVNADQALENSVAAERCIRISLALSADGRVLAEVADNGCGMTEEVLARAFEPFFTTKALGVGAGLGLPICKRIVDDVRGTIAIKSQTGRGTTVSLCLPSAASSRERYAPMRMAAAALDEARAASSADAAQVPGVAVAGRAHSRRRVLIVDDERPVAESLHAALRDVHDVDTAYSVAEARTLLGNGNDYDAVLCDLAMPVESGIDLHAYAVRHHPRLAERFIFMTGGAFTNEMSTFIDRTRCQRIEKPFALERMRALVDAAIAGAPTEVVHDPDATCDELT
jgi:PAS domain S-box-containing protein